MIYVRVRRMIVAAMALIMSVAGFSAEMDFSGVEKFWDIVSILEKDKDPPAELWDGLFATPGYAALTKSEFPRDFFVRQFELAFRPSRRGEREERLKSGESWAVRYLEHFIRVGEMRACLKAFIESLDLEPLAARAVGIAADWLPSSSIEGRPPVSFVVFGPDARGYTPVVIDILYGMNKGDSLVDLLAHEFHHYYRNRILVYDRGNVPAGDADVVWVFDQLQAEGMANMVTYRHLLGEDDMLEKLPGDFRDLVSKSPDIMKTLDTLLARMEDEPEERTGLGKELRRSIPWSGHPTGFFMALTVLDVLGADILIRETGDPFAFVDLYQQAAARKDGSAPLFSVKALEHLGKMKDRLLRPPHSRAFSKAASLSVGS